MTGLTLTRVGRAAEVRSVPFPTPAEAPQQGMQRLCLTG
jgi:hypothetical protein